MPRSRPERRKRHPMADWPWWKVFGLSLIVCSVLGAFVAFFPFREYTPGDVGIVVRAYGTPPRALILSPAAVALGAGLSLTATAVAIWNSKAFSWWSRLSAVAAFSLILLVMGARGFVFALPNPWLWAPPLVAGYLLAWALPAVDPRMSHFLYWEQFTPRTRVGRGCLAISLAVGGSAGALGAGLGMFSSRLGEVSATVWAIAVLCSVVSIDMAFVNAWELWPERPWASKTEDPTPPAQPE